MKDNIKPEHYRKGEIDLYEAFSQIFPHNEYRAGMQMIAMRYMFRDKIDRVEDLKKAIYSLERLKEKEIEYKEAQEKETGDKAPGEAFTNLGEVIRIINTSENIVKHKTAGQYLDEIYFEHGDLLKRLWNEDYRYLARDKNEELWAYDTQPIKLSLGWTWVGDRCGERLGSDYFPEVQWSDEEPTKISELLASYENGGENGK